MSGLLSAQGAEPIDFVWKSKSADLPGCAGKTVAYKVTKGQGAVGLANSKAKRQRTKIVLAANPTRSAQIAAAELNHYLEKMTGKRLDVVTDEAWPSKDGKILIGESLLTRTLGLKNSDFDEQEYLICTYGNILVLMGYDEPEHGIIHYDRHDLWDRLGRYYDWSLKPERSKKLGSVYAVHTFLQEFCGVRWYLPGELGEVCPKRDTVTVRNIDLRRKPWTSYRSIGMHYWEPKYLAKGDWTVRDIFLWQLRMKLFGIEAFNCNHSLIPAWFEKRTEKPQEIMAQGYARPTQLCLNSEELFRMVCQDADDYFAGKANWARAFGDYFPVMPHDTSHYCKCGKCQAQVLPVDKAIPTFWSNRASNYVWALVNRVAKYVKQKHPGKWVGCCSYARYTYYPDAPDLAKLEDNVFVMICRALPGVVRKPEYAELSNKIIEDWAKRVSRWYVWEYFSHIQGQREPAKFPGIFIHTIQRDMKLLHSLGCRGVFNEYETYLRDCALSHLNVYMHLQLMNDISYDVGQGFDEYCTLFYGPAAQPMEQILTRMEEQYSAIKDLELAPDARSIDWSGACNIEVLEELRALLEKAIAQATEDPYQRRVRWFRDEVFGLLEKHTLREEAKRKQGAFKLSVRPVKDDFRDFDGRVPHIPSFVRMDGDPTDRKTEAWLGYDAKHFYARVKCYESDLKSIRAVVKPSDISTDGINSDDSVEFFIDVGRTRQDYMQLLTNTNEAIRDHTRHHMRGFDYTYDSHATVKATKAEGHWTVEVAIPLSSLTAEPITKKTVWGLNICRNWMRKDKGGFRHPDAYTSWSPTYHGFHRPECFGLLRFAGEVGVQ